jgi:hypothetical protein
MMNLHRNSNHHSLSQPKLGKNHLPAGFYIGLISGVAIVYIAIDLLRRWEPIGKIGEAKRRFLSDHFS